MAAGYVTVPRELNPGRLPAWKIGPDYATNARMSAVFQHRMSKFEFLAWEQSQDLRYEFDGIAPVAMTGGAREHAGIQCNLAIAVGGRLRGGPCQYFGSDLKVETAPGYRYPDGFVVCAAQPRGATSVRDPVVIFEVLSESTSRSDTFTKNREYAAIPSVRRYVLLSQDEMSALVYERLADDWIGHRLDADAILRMPEIGIELPLAELYADVELASQP
jgi:Uma2 family endonuclease